MPKLKLTYETRIILEVDNEEDLQMAIRNMGLQGVKPIGFTSAQSHIKVIDSSPQPLLGTMASYEKQAVIDALAESNNNKSAAARLLGIERATLYTKIKEFNI